MSALTIVFTCSALLLAGLLGINWSVPLQAPAVILFGLAALCAIVPVLKTPGAEWEQSGNGKKRFPWLACLVLVAIAYFALRARFSPVWDLGIDDLMLILPAAILYLIAAHAMRGKAGISLRQGLAWTVILLLLLHIGSCIFQLQGGEGYSLERYFSGATRRNPEYVSGMYVSYGSFGNFAVIAGLLCLSLGIWGRFTYGMRALIFLPGILGLGLGLWSQSRSAALSLCIALGVLLIMLLISVAKQSAALKKRMVLIVSSLGALGLCGIVLGAVWVFEQRGVKSFAMIFDNSGVRVPMWAMAAEQWSGSPWLGDGSRSYSYECYSHWAPGIRYAEKEPVFAHNEYLQLLTDYGLIGLLLILGIFILHGRAGTKTVAVLSKKVGPEGFKQGSNAMALAIAGMAGMTAMAVHICFDFRTHILANLLLLVCCALWVLPVLRAGHQDGCQGAKGAKGPGLKDWGAGLMLLILGVWAIALGGQQWWAGLPLLQQRAATEVDAWEPQQVDREVWIPMLEKSLARAPQWRRYQQLGTLYMLEAAGATSAEQKQAALKKAEEACLAAIKRHALDPIARINLASVYAQQQRWQEADAMYASVSERAKVREPWYGAHTQWGELHHAMALSKWHEGKLEEARVHFTRAKGLFEMSHDHGVNGSKFAWATKYAQSLIAYAAFLDDESSYEEAGRLYELAGNIARGSSLQQETRVNFHHARHYYRHGLALWYDRRPDEASRMMLLAEKCMLQDKPYASVAGDAAWKQQMEQILEVLRFYKLTGVTP